MRAAILRPGPRAPRWWFAAIATLAPAVARPDVIWPAAVLEDRILTWWAIAAGLAIEWPVVRRITGTSWARSFGMNVATNLASTVLGFVLIPVLGLALGNFNPVTWGLCVALATTVNAAVEGATLRVAFHVSFTWRVFVLLFWANLVSVALAMASLLVSPPAL